MEIILSINQAPDAWGKNAILRFDSNKATIHLKNNEKTDRTLIPCPRNLRAAC